MEGSRQDCHVSFTTHSSDEATTNPWVMLMSSLIHSHGNADEILKMTKIIRTTESLNEKVRRVCLHSSFSSRCQPIQMGLMYVTFRFDYENKFDYEYESDHD